MELLWMVSAVDGECGDGEGKEAENCHGRCGGKVMELLWMVSALDGECGDGEGKEACRG